MAKKIECDIDFLKDSKTIKKELKRLGYTDDEIKYKSGIHSIPDMKAEIDIFMNWGTRDSERVIKLTEKGVLTLISERRKKNE